MGSLSPSQTPHQCLAGICISSGSNNNGPPSTTSKLAEDMSALHVHPLGTEARSPEQHELSFIPVCVQQIHCFRIALNLHMHQASKTHMHTTCKASAARECSCSSAQDRPPFAATLLLESTTCVSGAADVKQ